MWPLNFTEITILLPYFLGCHCNLPGHCYLKCYYLKNFACVNWFLSPHLHHVFEDSNLENAECMYKFDLRVMYCACMFIICAATPLTDYLFTFC